MDESVVEGFEEYVKTERGVTFSIVRRNPYGFYHAKASVGHPPVALKDAFTNIRDCVRAIDKYVKEQPPLRVQENKEPPVLRRKPVRKPKADGKTASS